MSPKTIALSHRFTEKGPKNMQKFLASDVLELAFLVAGSTFAIPHAQNKKSKPRQLL